MVNEQIPPQVKSDSTADARPGVPAAPTRRKFLRHLSGGAALASGVPLLSALLSPGRAAAKEIAEQKESPADSNRAGAARRIREEAARRDLSLPFPDHPSNGDEQRYPNHIGNYSKGLPHNQLGEVDPGAYNSLIAALESGRPSDFENIILGLGRKLTNPQSGLAFELEGPDSQALFIPPAPAFASAEEAAEIAENYWMALARDIPFSEYDTTAITQQAADDLSRLSDFKAPKSAGQVTPATLFRGNEPGCLTGPYISQFFWLDTPFGAEQVSRRINSSLAGLDFMTDYASWLAIQNGAAAGPTLHDSTPRYIRNGRDLGEWVHIDVLFQAYFEAFLILQNIGAPLDPGNPYTQSRTQIGFGTLGAPYFASVLGAVARSALQAVWFQKWFVHRRVRPEMFAGRVHNHVTGAAHYPIHPQILNSSVLNELSKKYGTFLLPMAFPEGCPTHPAYGAGHATVAGACATVLKAFFDESFVIPDPVEAASDGLSLNPFVGPPLTVGGELNKLASNVAIGRNIAGVHWRSDATESLKLGEEIAIRYLQDEHDCFNEQFRGLSITRFDGSTVTV